MKKYFTFLLALGLLNNLHAQTAGDYRSNLTTGNWNATASWQRFDGAGWVAAPAVPTNADGVISILSGHNITVSTTVTADQVEVNAGGTLTITSTLNLNNGTGDDLTVNGTLAWQSGTLGAPGNAVIAAAGTLNLTTSSRILNANLTNNGIINWQDGSVLHNATSTVTNNGIININSTTNLSWTNSGAGHIFINNGTITKTAAGTTNFAANSFTNAGTMNVNAGTMQNSSTAWNNTGTLSFNGGSFVNSNVFNHNTGSVINGTGSFTNNSTMNLNINQAFPSTLVFASTQTIQGAGNLTVNNNFTIEGTIQGAGSLTLNGSTNTWPGGTLARALTLAAGQTLNLTTSSRILNANLTNNGIINWQDGSVLHNAASTVTNNGTININSTTNLSWTNSGAGHIFINNGTITKTAAGTTNFAANSFTNAGTMNVNAGTMQNSSTAWNNTGTLSFNGGSFVNSNVFNHNTGSVINGTGSFTNNSTMNLNINQAFPSTLVFASTQTIQGAGDLTVNNNFTIEGTIQGVGSLTLNGSTNTWPGGTLARALTLAAGQTLNLTTNSRILNANLTNNGIINWQDGSVLHNAASTVTNNGTININSTTNLSWTNSGAGHTFINNGTITKTTTNGVTTFAASAYTNSSAGIIKGVGTINNTSTVFNSNGFIAPGLSPGLLTFNTAQPLSSNSTLQIEMQDGSGAGTGHDQLIRNGNLTLAGTLTVTETGTVPNGTYTIINLTAGTVSGSFTTTNLPAGYTLQVNANNVQVIRNVVLPVQLISFDAEKQNDKVALTWKTDNEQNTSYFNVERSDDGINYTVIGTVAAFNTPGLHVYNFIDNQPLPKKNFYRLRQVDIDNKFEISQIIRVDFDKKFTLKIYPNPVSNQIILIGVKTGSRVSVFDATGKLLFLQLWSGMPIDASRLPGGIYHLRVDVEGEILITQFIK